jgi:hypothetical protein
MSSLSEIDGLENHQPTGKEYRIESGTIGGILNIVRYDDVCVPGDCRSQYVPIFFVRDSGKRTG